MMKTNMALRQQLLHAYKTVRSKTKDICKPLATEDYVIQSIDDVSPPKWHLAHTSWFFENFILMPFNTAYPQFHPLFHHLFNSYYYTVGNPYPRFRRGILSRPTVETIYEYRRHIDKHVTEFIEVAPHETLLKLQSILYLGLNHEEQHQELLLMDIKHNFSLDPNFPAFLAQVVKHDSHFTPLHFVANEGGVIEIGYEGENFCFDNELPRHQMILKPFSVASRLVTNGEYVEFIESGAYQKPEGWLADGWECIQKSNWQAPLYWKKIENEWYAFTLGGLKKIDLNEPVSHISYYEADAYATFRGCRLPTEAEWEYHTYLHHQIQNGNFLENGLYHPIAISAKTNNKMHQLLGDLWEWTSSSYSPYPGYKPLHGPLGEYNGKFMSSQMVLRGGSCVTPKQHVRLSYRNFFQPDKRWQFSGIRLAKDLSKKNKNHG